MSGQVLTSSLNLIGFVLCVFTKAETAAQRPLRGEQLARPADGEREDNTWPSESTLTL